MPDKTNTEPEFIISDTELYPKYSVDAMIRYAVSGNDMEMFLSLTERFFSHFDASLLDVISVMLILYKKRKYEMLDIFADRLRNTITGINSLTNGSLLNSYRLKDHIDTICKYIFGSSKQKTAVSDKEFLSSPLYFAMLAGDTHSIGADFCGTILRDDYMQSAIAFRDTEALKAMFECGWKLSPDTVAIFCRDPETIEYLCTNFPEQTGLDKYDEFHSDISGREFVFNTVPPEKMILFARKLYGLDPEHFGKIFDGSFKIYTVDEIHKLHLEFFYARHAMGRLCFGDIFADTVTLNIQLIGLPPLHELSPLPCKFVYDFSRTIFETFLHVPVGSVLEFLETEETVFRSDCLSLPVMELLNYNDKRIIDFLISKSVINNTDVKEIKKYLTDKKLYDALEAVNNSEIPRTDDLPF